MIGLSGPAGDPTAVGTWVLIGLGVLGSSVLVAQGILSIVRHLWPGKVRPLEPNPLIVKGHVEYTPLADHLRLADKVDAHRSEALSAIQAVDEGRRVSVSKAYDAMREAQSSGRAELREEIGKIHDRLNNHTAILGEIRGEIKNLNGRGTPTTER